jgi:hypothetical protein
VGVVHDDRDGRVDRRRCRAQWDSSVGGDLLLRSPAAPDGPRGNGCRDPAVDRARRRRRLGAGAGAALLGGILVYLLALGATRALTVTGPRRLGTILKLATAGLILALLPAEAILPPLALAGALAAALIALVFLLHTFVPDAE